MTARHSGSRFLYEPFDAATVRIEANEKVADAKWDALDQRLKHIEHAIDRMERRIWLGVSGLAAFLAMDMAYRLLPHLN